MNLNAPQPAPVGTGLEVWPLVMQDIRHEASPELADLLVADMEERNVIGTSRYGTPLRTGNGRDSLVDAYQEVLDACVYLRAAMHQPGGGTLELVYGQALGLAVDLRWRLRERDGR